MQHKEEGVVSEKVTLPPWVTGRLGWGARKHILENEAVAPFGLREGGTHCEVQGRGRSLKAQEVRILRAGRGL